MNRSISVIAILLIAAISTAGCAGEAKTTYRHAELAPIGLHEAKITGGYFGPFIDTSVEKGVLDYLQKFEDHGYIDNYRLVVKEKGGLVKLRANKSSRGPYRKRPQKVAAGDELRGHYGGPNCNEFVYKLMQAAGYYANRSDKIRSRFAELNELVLEAQDDNGYLNTYYRNPAWRFDRSNRYEFYNFGHFTQAAIAWYRTTGRRDLLDGAIRFADLICNRFGDKSLPYERNRDGQVNLKYEHPNHELAMVELYRVTGEKRYLDFAAHTLDDYDFWKEKEVWGHAVQESLLLAAGADVYLELGREEMLEHLRKMWRDVHDRKTYLTGGVGSQGKGESFGKAYYLPNRTAYCETCAAISMDFFHHKMLQATGEVKFADALERTLYNAVLGGISLSGTEYFYRQPQETGGPRARRRSPWFGCSCCPPNVHRHFAHLHQLLYIVDETGVQVHLYNTSELRTRTSDGREIALDVTTDYPLDGRVEIRVLRPGLYTLKLRIPAWSRGATCSINEAAASKATPGEYLALKRRWKAGDTVVLEIPLRPRVVKGNPKVAAQRGKVAIMRGPLVYCLESVDNPDFDIFKLKIPVDTKLQEVRSEALGGTVMLRGGGVNAVAEVVNFTAIAYHLWANRKPSDMRIWFEAAGDGVNSARTVGAM